MVYNDDIGCFNYIIIISIIFCTLSTQGTLDMFVCLALFLSVSSIYAYYPYVDLHWSKYLRDQIFSKPYIWKYIGKNPSRL